MRLENLKRSITNMDRSQAIEIIEKWRRSREIYKAPRNKAQKKRRQNKKTIINLVQSLSENEIKELLNILEDDDEN